MHTFHLISKKIVGFDDKYDLSEQPHIFKNIYIISFFIFFQKTYSIQNKFIFLNETIYNIFHNCEIKETFLNYFNKIQKTYNAFARFAFLFKYKKAKTMVDTDLIMNEISENGKYVYCLFQNNCKYLFNIHDLIKIIHNSIANSYFFFSNPTPIKNPYNNIVLSKSTLYNIYFFITIKTFLHPELFYYFFKTDFDLNNFIKKYQYLLRNFSIKNYLTNCNKNAISTNINCMIDEYNSLVKYRQQQIIIDHTFPKDLLINIMKPYLELFITSQYSLLYVDRIYCKKLLKQKLSEFNKFNPTFGRKIYKKYTDLFSHTTERFEYDSKHISFHEITKVKDKNEFMNNHATNLIEDYDANDIDYEDDDDDDNNGNNANNNNNDDDSYGDDDDDDDHH